ELLPLGLGLFVLLAVAGAIDRPDARRALLPLLVVALPIAAMLAVWSQVPKVNPRYLVAVAPVAYVLAAWALAALFGVRWPARAVGVAATAGVLAVSVWGLQGTYAAQKDDYRSLA